MRILSSAPAEIHYPESDGKPMAESDIHRDWMVCIISRLKRYYAGKRVYISGNMLVYYVKGNPRKSFAPDVFAVKDCEPRRRKIFKIWEEGKAPDWIMETTSDSTKNEDTGLKKQIYAQLKVPEYFLYDPLGDWLDPPLQGFRLLGDAYVRVEPDAHGGIASEQLGVTFRLEAGELAMFETATGKRLLSDQEHADEESRRAEAEKQRAEAEKQRAEAEKHYAASERQRADSERQRADSERQRADSEKQRAETEAQRAELEARRTAEAQQQLRQAEERLAQEAVRRQALEEELARLKATGGS